MMNNEKILASSAEHAIRTAMAVIAAAESLDHDMTRESRIARLRSHAQAHRDAAHKLEARALALESENQAVRK